MGIADLGLMGDVTKGKHGQVVTASSPPAVYDATRTTVTPDFGRQIFQRKFDAEGDECDMHYSSAPPLHVTEYVRRYRSGVRTAPF